MFRSDQPLFGNSFYDYFYIFTSVATCYLCVGYLIYLVLEAKELYRMRFQCLKNFNKLTSKPLSESPFHFESQEGIQFWFDTR
jgi:hypothetical protein